MSTRKAVVHTSQGVAEVRSDVPRPKLRDDYIIVKTKAVALNPTDWKSLGPARRSPGAIAGCDYAGVVEEVGKAVTTPFKKGDKVAGFVFGGSPANHDDGAFASHVTAKGDLQIRIAEHISFEDAATLGRPGHVSIPRPPSPPRQNQRAHLHPHLRSFNRNRHPRSPVREALRPQDHRHRLAAQLRSRQSPWCRPSLRLQRSRLRQENPRSYQRQPETSLRHYLREGLVRGVLRRAQLQGRNVHEPAACEELPEGGRAKRPHAGVYRVWREVQRAVSR
jgi:hypothetical protein